MSLIRAAQQRLPAPERDSPRGAASWETATTTEDENRSRIGVMAQLADSCRLPSSGLRPRASLHPSDPVEKRPSRTVTAELGRKQTFIHRAARRAARCRVRILAAVGKSYTMTRPAGSVMSRIGANQPISAVGTQPAFQIASTWFHANLKGRRSDSRSSCAALSLFVVFGTAGRARQEVSWAPRRSNATLGDECGPELAARDPLHLQLDHALTG